MHIEKSLITKGIDVKRYKQRIAYLANSVGSDPVKEDTLETILMEFAKNISALDRSFNVEYKSILTKTLIKKIINDIYEIFQISVTEKDRK